MSFFLFLILELAAASSDWDYVGKHGTHFWKNQYPNCAKPYQSPIDIPSREKLDPCYSLLGLNLTGFNKNADFTVLNNGHTAVVKVGDKNEHIEDDIFYMDNGKISKTVIKYKTSQFHFHWAESSTAGSEHTINGKRYSLELHIVNYNEKYSSIQEALAKPDGLAVLAVLFKVSKNDNINLSPLIKALKDIKAKGTESIAKNLNIYKLLPSKKECFYRYAGSLTTPNCYESVTWTIFCEINTISERQLRHFRELCKDSTSENTIGHNFRDTMERHDRHVCKSNIDWEEHPENADIS